MEEKIDFVITWVDGNDEEWLKEKNKYVQVKINGDTDSKNRYRDMNTLQYWFRAVEKYAPWVNKIYFITWGHLPEWLDTSNEKLVIVNHKDYIPAEILPTFNSNSIEMYIHKIKGLSEKFVYFNDDMFIGKPVKPVDFFKNGKPRDTFIFNSMVLNKTNSTMSGIIYNNTEMIAEVFDKKEVVKQNRRKIFNFKYGKEIIRTILLMPWNGFTGIYDPHMPISYKKSSFEEVWDRFSDRIYNSTKNRVRTKNDISHWVVRYWQLVKGDFEPKKMSIDKYYSGKNDIKDICKSIKKKKYKLLCINDANVDDFDAFTKQLVEAFENALPDKSSFEK